MRHVAPLSSAPSLDCAYFPSPRGCTTTLYHQQKCEEPCNPPASSLDFSRPCSLFCFSLRSFQHSRPLFSIVCSLFSQNTRSGGWSRLASACFHSGLLAVAPGSEARCFRLDSHCACGERSHRSRRIWLGGRPRLTRTEPVTCRRREPHAPSPRALPLLERHAWQRRRHAPRRRHTVGTTGGVTIAASLRRAPCKVARDSDTRCRAPLRV